MDVKVEKIATACAHRTLIKLSFEIIFNEEENYRNPYCPCEDHSYLTQWGTKNHNLRKNLLNNSGVPKHKNESDVTLLKTLLLSYRKWFWKKREASISNTLELFSYRSVYSVQFERGELNYFIEKSQNWIGRSSIHPQWNCNIIANLVWMFGIKGNYNSRLKSTESDR